MNGLDLLGNFGGRKFIICLMALASVTVVYIAGCKAPAELLDFVKWVLGFYFASQGLADGLSKGVTSSTALVPAAPPEKPNYGEHIS